MKQSTLCTIASYLMPEDAGPARAALDDAGIASYLECENATGMLSLYSNAMGGVKLQVAEEDEAAAREILAGATASPDDEAQTQTCPHCQADNPAGFEVCWSCGHSIGTIEDAAASQVEVDSPPEPSQPLREPTEADLAAWRAFMAAVFGALFFPPFFTLYAVYLLLRTLFVNQPLSRSGKWYFSGAVFFNLLGCIIASVIIRLI